MLNWDIHPGLPVKIGAEDWAPPTGWWIITNQIWISTINWRNFMKYSRIVKILLLDYTAFYLSWSRLVNKYQFWIVMAIAIIFMAVAENTGNWNVVAERKGFHILFFFPHYSRKKIWCQTINGSTGLVVWLTSLDLWPPICWKLYRSGWLQISSSNINVGLSLTINYLRRMTISKNTIHFCETAVIEWNSLSLLLWWWPVAEWCQYPGTHSPASDWTPATDCDY